MRARIRVGRDSRGEYDLERFVWEVRSLDLLASVKLSDGPVEVTELADSKGSRFE